MCKPGAEWLDPPAKAGGYWMDIPTLNVIICVRRAEGMLPDAPREPSFTKRTSKPESGPPDGPVRRTTSTPMAH